MNRVRGVMAVLLGSTLTLTACQGDPAPPSFVPPTTAAPAVTPRPAGGLATTGWGPDIPDKGAWLGAWVRPDGPENPASRVAALTAFGEQTGGKVAVGHMFHDWAKNFPSPTERAYLEAGMLPLVSWSGTDTRSITSGVYDQLIRRRAEEIKQLNVPILLRWRWEMDRPNLAASVRSPEDYVAAWKHIRAIFVEVGTTNAGFVWCPHVLGFVEPGRNAAAYYPGDDQVDWLCTDVYPGPDFDGFAPQMDAFMAFASKHPRPVLIGEFGVTTAGKPGQRGGWLREAHEYVKRHPQIKAVVYFAQKNEKPKYDSTFDDDPEGLAAYREFATDPYFAVPPPEAVQPN
ncbi:glycoside hydrolase family 26 protein [Micromonospora echinofusca]|nr:beta-mannanase [Micromonospora echinofusca]